MVPEKLESRALFSVTVTQAPSGTLTVTGTDGADTIAITQIDVPAENDFGVPAGPIVFVVDGDTPVNAPDGQPFFQGVKRLRVLGKGGDDNITYFANDLSATIQGDAGNDNIIINDDADDDGIGGSVIYGGDGDDFIGIEHAGKVTIAFGDTGNDEFTAALAGTRGSAIVFGNAGNDSFLVSGKVLVIGGAGTDTAVAIDGDSQPILIT